MEDGLLVIRDTFREYGTELPIKNTESQVVRCGADYENQCLIQLDDHIIKNIRQLKYLGIFIGPEEANVMSKLRVASGLRTFAKKSSFFCDPQR